eukprot:37845-Chlamydomonas_euryale.AAC.4
MAWLRTVRSGVPFVAALSPLLGPLYLAALNTGMPLVDPLPATLTLAAQQWHACTPQRVCSSQCSACSATPLTQVRRRRRRSREPAQRLQRRPRWLKPSNRAVNRLSKIQSFVPACMPACLSRRARYLASWQSLPPRAYAAATRARRPRVSAGRREKPAAICLQRFPRCRSRCLADQLIISEDQMPLPFLQASTHSLTPFPGLRLAACTVSGFASACPPLSALHTAQWEAGMTETGKVDRNGRG